MRSSHLIVCLVASCLMLFARPTMAGEASVELEKPVRLQAGGKPVDSGAAWGHSGPCLHDVDEDGLPDLVVGDFSGKFRVYHNRGAKGRPKFVTESYNLMAGDAEAEVPIYCCIGSSPVFADFNGDGKADLLSGSYDPGECYLFRGLGEGKFVSRETIVDKTGKPVLRHPDQKQEVQSFGSWPAPVDWDDDGDLDLLIGGFDGTMFVRVNEGSATAPQLAVENTPVMLGDEELKLPSAHAAVAVADWDDDGRWDILSGSDSGAVYWYRNVGEKGLPRFELEVTLVPAHDGNGYDELLEAGAAPRVGIRTQIAVVDYNDDGRLDLLVGDFCTNITPKADLSDDDRAKMEAIQEEITKSGEAMKAAMDGLREDFKTRYPGEKIYSDEVNKEFQEAYKELQESELFKTGEAKSEELTKSLGEYLAKPEKEGSFNPFATTHGWVWLFLRADGARPAQADKADDKPKAAKATGDGPVDAELVVTPTHVAAGGAATVEVRAEMSPGWHIWPLVEGGFVGEPTALELTLPEGVEFSSEWQSPEPRAAARGTGKSYEGRVIFRRELKIADDAKPGDVELVCRFSYQACDKELCLRPATDELHAVIIVNEPESPAASP